MPDPSDNSPTDPVGVPDLTPVDPDSEALASRVGEATGGEPEPLAGTDTMGVETGGLAGTSR